MELGRGHSRGGAKFQIIKFSIIKPKKKSNFFFQDKKGGHGFQNLKYSIIKLTHFKINLKNSIIKLNGKFKKKFENTPISEML